MTHIFLSPHLDDAVFSCGGLISKLVYQQEEVIIITPYTRNLELDTIPKKFHKFAIYEQRKEEDKKALEKLGAEYFWLDLSERAYRNPKIKKPTDVFKLNIKDGLSQFPNVYKIHEVLEKYLEKYPEAIFYAPLGIGNHFDHIEVFLSALIYMVDEALYDKFRFYVDSYGMFSTKIRKKHFLGKELVKEGIKRPENTSVRFFFISRIINAMISGNNFQDLLKPKYRELKWKRLEESIEGYEKLMLSSLECYVSQVKLFGKKEVRKVILQYHKNWNNSIVLFLAEPSLI